MNTKKLDRKELHKRVNEVLEVDVDYELQHGLEDRLHLEIIKQFCPSWVLTEVKRLSDDDFPRFTA